jgi:hypothetical protein
MAKSYLLIAAVPKLFLNLAIDGVVRCYLETWKPGCFDKTNAEMEFIRSNEINVHFQGIIPRDIVLTVLCCYLPLEKLI